MRRPLLHLGALLACVLACGCASGRANVPADGQHLPPGHSLGPMKFVEAGSVGRPAMVLVHGLGEKASEDWRPVLEPLSRSFHVFAPDLPGFGASERGDALYSPENLAASLHQFVQERLEGPFILVGHSMGGAVSLEYAARHPERVARLVLIDCAGILHRTEITQAMLRSMAGWEGASWPEEVTGRVESRGASPSRILESRLLRTAVLRGNPNSIAALALLERNFGPVLDAVRAPTLLLWGARDEVAPLRTGRVLQQRLASAELVIAAEVGHVPMSEAPEWVVEQIQAFAARPLPAASGAPQGAPGHSGRIARCHRERDWVLTGGTYDRVELERCEGARIVDVHTSELVVRHSEVQVEAGRIDAGSAVAVRAEESRLSLTGTRVRGSTCLQTAGSILDLAGVVAECASSFVHAQRASKITLSVVRAETPKGVRHLHAFEVLRGGSRL